MEFIMVRARRKWGESGRVAVLQDLTVCAGRDSHHLQQFSTTSESTQLRAQGFCSLEGTETLQKGSTLWPGSFREGWVARDEHSGRGKDLGLGWCQLVAQHRLRTVETTGGQDGGCQGHQGEG